MELEDLPDPADSGSSTNPAIPEPIPCDRCSGRGYFNKCQVYLSTTGSSPSVYSQEPCAFCGGLGIRLAR
jgi:hypothetical protein